MLPALPLLRLLVASLAASALASEAPLDVVSDCFQSEVLDLNEQLSARPHQVRCIQAIQEACASDPYVIGYSAALDGRLCEYHVVEWLAGNYTDFNSWHVDVFEVLADLAAQQGLTWPQAIFTADISICTNTYEQNIAWAYQWSSYVLAWSHKLRTGTWGSPDFPVRNMHETFRQHRIDGPTMCSMRAEDYVSIGLPFGVARAFVAGMNNYLFGQLEAAPGATVYQPQEAKLSTTYPGRPANVSISIVLEHLYNINEIDYTFNIGFMIMMSWEDDRISTRCEGAGSNGDEVSPSDPCAHYWQPQMRFSNVLQYEEGTYEVINDFGLFTEVGMASVRAAESDKNIYLPHSLAYNIKRVKGTFVTPMGFKYFPFDCQTLLLRATAISDDATIYRYVPLATIAPSLRALLRQTDGEANVVSGWNVTSIHTREYLLSEQSTAEEFIDTSIQHETYTSMDQVESQHGPGVPIYDAIVRLRDQIPVVELSESEDYKRDELHVPGLKPYSAAYFAIQVQREPHTFLWNFSALVALLIFIAFSSFLFPDKDMNGRISLALTVFLGVIFFQILIVESLPRTGSFTTMHLFMFLSSVFNGIIVLEHALVYALNAWVGKQAAIIQRVKLLSRSPRAVAFAVRLQRAFRMHRIHKFHMEAISPEPGPKAKSGTRGATRRSVTRGLTVDPASIEQVHAELASESPPPSDSDRRSIELNASGESQRIEVEATMTVVQDAVSTSHSGSMRHRAKSDLVWLSNTKSVYTHHLEARMKMADTLAKGTPLKRILYRHLFNWMVVFLDNSNRFFVITTSFAYFVLVYYYVFLRIGEEMLDAKCSDPWTTAGVDPRIILDQG